MNTPFKQEINSLVMENQALLADAAQRVLDVHEPCGPDRQALEAAIALLPLTPYQLERIKTLAREFLQLCL